MKLSSQLANALPLSSKMGRATLRGSDAFAAAMHPLMGAPAWIGPFPMKQGTPEAHSAQAILIGPTMSGDGLQSSAEETRVQMRGSLLAAAVAVASLPSGANPGQVDMGLTNSSTTNFGATAPHEASGQAGIPQLVTPQSGPIEAQGDLPPQTIPERGIQMGDLKILPDVESALGQSAVMPATGDGTSSIPASSPTQHKAGKQVERQPEISHPSHTLTAPVAPLPFAVPLSMPPLDAAPGGGVPLNPGPPLLTPRKSSDTPLNMQQASIGSAAPTPIGDKHDRFPNVTSQQPAFRQSTNADVASSIPEHEHVDRDTVTRSLQTISPEVADQLQTSSDASPVHTNPHAAKDEDRRAAAVTKETVAERSLVQPLVIPGPVRHEAPTPHGAALNLPAPPPLIHRMDGLSEGHRAQADAAQVLQRMDMAVPSGAAQLRAGARQLDVGVSSISLGWVELRATASPSGRVDAALHVETNVSAHLLTAQSKEIADYAREHSVPLGQISVGVGTGEHSRGHSRPPHEPVATQNAGAVRGVVKDRASSETRPSAERVSLISLRA